MSEMTSVVETQQQQQQYVDGTSNAMHQCQDCGLKFNGEKSLEVHLHYQHNGSQLGSKAQQEESNNNHSKTGNHNNHSNVNRNSVAVPADSSEQSSMPPSQDPTSSQQQQPQQQSHQQQQQQQQPIIHTLGCQPYDHFQTQMFPENNYYMPNDQSYMLSHHFSPPQEEQSNRDNGGGYPRYHPYHQQHYSVDRTTSSPQLQCDKCGAVYEDANQLGEHMRTNHLDSPTAYPSAPQYQQLGNSPQQQLHPSPPLSNQPQQQSGYDYNGGQTVKSEMKQEPPEEQTEILDLDSHKVQKHRLEEEYVRLQQQQQQQQQGLQIQMQQRLIQQQQQQQQHRIGSHSVSSMLGWPPATQTHDYHSGLGPMGPLENVPPPIADQSQFMRGQHMPVEHGHQSSPIITSTQPMTGHQMPAGFVQQSSKTAPNQGTWKSNEPRRPKTYNCTACNKWFTSSGHLKRHYNTTLHKNAVKNGKEPDPATLPISVHHHPSRDNNHSGGRGGGAPARSPPDLPSSRSPPNLMAGPSDEATGGLLHTPTPHCNSNSSNSNSNSSSDSSAAVLAQQQLVHLSHPGMMPVNSPVPSSLAGHHQQQMGSAPHQLGLQQQQQQQQPLHLPTDSAGQSAHHTTTSPLPPQAASHMNCPSPMGSSPHPHPHMNSPPGSVHPAMTSPTSMGGTSMPHQQYPNALPPRVTITTSTPVLLESTQPVTMLTTIGNDQQHQSDMLPSFTIFDQKNFTPIGLPIVLGVECYAVENQIQTVNVGGLNAEEIAPQESFESSTSNYDPYSPSRYKPFTDMDITTNGEQLSYQFEEVRVGPETNNNHLSQLRPAKEDLNSNISLKPKKERKNKVNLNRQRPVVTGVEYISKDGCHQCLSCDKNFMRGCYLTQHLKSFHSGEKPFKCNQCGKRFSNEEQHEKHVQMHTCARKHRCEACPKVFAHKTDLKRHSCIHTGKRPFTCDTCGKGFIRQDHMKKHKDTHTKKARHAQRQNAQRQNAQRHNGQRFNAQRINIQRLNVQQSNVQQLNVQNNYDSKL